MKEKKMTQEITEKAQKNKKKQKKGELQTETVWIGEKGNAGDPGARAPQGPKGLPGTPVYVYGYSKKDIKRMKKEEKRRRKHEKKRRAMEKKLNEILLWCEEENYSVKDVKRLAECLKNGAEEQRVKHKKTNVNYI